MTAKEKASSILREVTSIIWESNNTVTKPMCKQMADYVVNKIISSNPLSPSDKKIDSFPNRHNEAILFWLDVKNEIKII